MEYRHACKSLWTFGGENGATIGLDARAACFFPEYMARARPPAECYLPVPFTDDVEVSMRIG